MIGADAIVRRAEGTLWRRCPRSAVVLVDDEVHRLAATGADIWDLLSVPSTTDTLAAQLASRYEVDHHGITEDVARAVDGLLSAGVLELISPPGQ